MFDFRLWVFLKCESMGRIPFVFLLAVFFGVVNTVQADGPPPPCADPCSTGCPTADSPCCDMPIPSDCCDIEGASDCNNNQVKDSCDLTYGVSIDCNDNLLPDICDVEAGNPPVAKTYERFYYDALGRRIAKVSDRCDGPAEETRYYYSGDSVILETDAANTPLRSYINGAQYIDERLLMRDETLNTDFYYMERENHTVAGLVVNTGYVVESYDYHAYGSPKIYDGYQNEVDPAEGSVWGNPYFFTGRHLDIIADRGLNQGSRTSNVPLSWPRQLYHYRARTMDPIHGRFMQRDPAGYVDGMNLYEYAKSNPGRLTDPYGLWGRDVHFEDTLELAKLAGFACPEFLAVAANRPDADGINPNDTWNDGRFKKKLERDPPTAGIGYGVHQLNRPRGPYGSPPPPAVQEIWESTNKEWLRRIALAAEWHFPADDDGIVRPDSKVARQKAEDGLRRCHLNDFGEGLHVLQDSWAHQGRPGFLGIGHYRGVKTKKVKNIIGYRRHQSRLGGPVSMWPVYGPPKIVYVDASGSPLTMLKESRGADNVEYWPEDAREAGFAVYDLMDRFLKKCKCACPGPGGMVGLAGKDMTTPLPGFRLFRTAVRQPAGINEVKQYLWDKYGRYKKNVVSTTWIDAVKR